MFIYYLSPMYENVCPVRAGTLAAMVTYAVLRCRVVWMLSICQMSRWIPVIVMFAEAFTYVIPF